ncbi:DUF6455 family protein [Pelagibius sp. CAU 1746]|uniref:DUF6455 family protein n=1 Tax=Pelagibius sp. CAU 1746 TaxID=3140370 RepID=UPI00325AB872
MTNFLSRMELHSKLMGQMMERCGVDAGQLAQDRLGATLAAAARACMACGRTDSCQRWLEATDGGVEQIPPAFCPNARRLAAQKPQ